MTKKILIQATPLGNNVYYDIYLFEQAIKQAKDSDKNVVAYTQGYLAFASPVSKHSLT